MRLHSIPACALWLFACAVPSAGSAQAGNDTDGLAGEHGPAPAVFPGGSPDDGAVAPASMGFELDENYRDVMARLGKPLIANVAVGDAVAVPSYALCFESDRLMVWTAVGPSTGFWEDYAFMATRSESGFLVDVVPVVDRKPLPGQVPAREALVDAIAAVAGAGACDPAVRYSGVMEVLPVEAVNGHVSLGGLMGELDREPEAQPENVAFQSEAETAWTITEETDEITDQPNVYLRSESKEPVYGGIRPKRLSMLIRCQRNTTALYVVHGDYEVNDTMQVSWRVDGGAAKSGRWEGSSDRKAVGLWNGGRSIPFLRSISGGTELIMRLQGRSDTYDVAFSLDGLTAALAKVAQACNWKL
ncbi:MAG: hypothetical protein CML46_10710 [Rhodobacteraceae bacterium]|nr:hypothetical protein [Paracoccaceae bacterium]MBR27396.1 hypothetical protein [Paracoccaceae bacterium]